MNLITNILFFGAAVSTVIASDDNSMHPLLDAKGVVGTRDCGNQNGLVKISSLTVETCDKTPCQLFLKDALTVSIEFIPLENITSLSTTVTAVLPVGRLPLVTVDTCKVLAVGECPYIKGETYLQAILLDMPKLITPEIEKFLKDNGNIAGVSEIVISNPEKSFSVCASYEVNVV